MDQKNTWQIAKESAETHFPIFKVFVENLVNEKYFPSHGKT